MIFIVFEYHFSYNTLNLISQITFQTALCYFMYVLPYSIDVVLNLSYLCDINDVLTLYAFVHWYIS